MDATQNLQQVLSYRVPVKKRQTPPSPVLATLLHLPGTACWIILMSAAANFRLSISISDRDRVVCTLWVLALVTAVGSIHRYARPSVRKTAFVVVNLAINISGLVFSLLVSPIVLLCVLFGPFRSY